MPTPEVNNATKTDDLCEGCGACCAPGILGQMTDPYLEVTQDDLKDEFTSKSKLSVKSAVGGPMGLDSMFGEDGRLFLPVVRGDNDFTQCEHLCGLVLCGANCGCYHTRPTACRIFEPGGPMYQRLRHAWMVHQDKVAWKKRAQPNLTHDEAVYSVVKDGVYGRPLGAGDTRILESLGKGPDYVYLRERRDKDRALEEVEKKAESALKLERVTRKVRKTQRMLGTLDEAKQEAPKKTKSPA